MSNTRIIILYTEDSEKISFAQQFCPDFKNAHAINYVKNDSYLLLIARSGAFRS